MAVVFATRWTRVTSFRAAPALRREVVFLRAEDLRRVLFARDALFRAVVDRFLVEDLRALLLRALLLRAVVFRVVFLARLGDPERLRAALPLLRREERLLPDDFLAAMVLSSCFGGSPCCARKNRAQPWRPVAGRPLRQSSTTYQNGEEGQCEHA